MGTDIHGVFQRHNHDTNTWEDIPHQYEMDRHYQLFAVLAGVRNGIGFAGVPTGEVVKPISAPRGYPEDFQVDEENRHLLAQMDHMDPRRRDFYELYPTIAGENPLQLWMGDHSHSWLTADEMLDWYATAPAVIQVGIISRADYDTWNHKTAPEHGWRGGISGPGVVVVNDNDIERSAKPEWTHIRVEWERSLAEELDYFFAEVARLKAEHEQVRFVFGFDS